MNIFGRCRRNGLRRGGKQASSGRGSSLWGVLFVVLGVIIVWEVKVATAPVIADSNPQAANPAFERCVWENDRKLFSAVRAGGPVLHGLTPCVSASKEAGNAELRQFIEELTKGYPIAAMAPEIATKEKEIAALVIGIGKKESDWGKHTPKMQGAECFNYWGYRAPGSLGLTPSGYGCFSTPAEGARVIGERLETLVQLRRSSEPARMIVWKCGSSCAGHHPDSVGKWIRDVEQYYRKIVALEL